MYSSPTNMVTLSGHASTLMQTPMLSSCYIGHTRRNCPPARNPPYRTAPCPRSPSESLNSDCAPLQHLVEPQQGAIRLQLPDQICSAMHCSSLNEIKSDKKSLDTCSTALAITHACPHALESRLSEPADHEPRPHSPKQHIYPVEQRPAEAYVEQRHARVLPADIVIDDRLLF